MKESKKYTHTFERGGIVYVSGSIKGKRYRLSTGKSATPANMKWVDTNWRSCIENILDSTPEKKVGKVCDDKLLLKNYGLKSLEANKTNRRELTNKEYANIFEKRIIPFFGDKLLTEIVATDLMAWQGSLLEEGLSGARVHNIRTVFYGILKNACGDRIIHDNPFDFTPGVSIDDPEIFPFTLSEAYLLIEKAEGWFKNMVTLALFTGMRTGEMMALRWKNVDFKTNTIKVKEAVRGGIRGDVKTKASRREIVMLPIVKEALKAQYLMTGLKNQDVFVSSLGEGFGHSVSLSEPYWHPLCVKCDLEKRDFYHTRHTFATLMISHGEDILWVANMMGHKDISMVMKKYAKYRKDDSVKRAAFLDVRASKTQLGEASKAC